MCGVHRWLVDQLDQLGATQVRIKHGGSRGCSGRHHNHPFLTGYFEGRYFQHPVKAQPHDSSTEYRRRYLKGICEEISHVLGRSIAPNGRQAFCRKSKRRPRLKPARAKDEATVAAAPDFVPDMPDASGPETVKFAIVDLRWMREGH